MLFPIESVNHMFALKLVTIPPAGARTGKEDLLNLAARGDEGDLSHRSFRKPDVAVRSLCIFDGKLRVGVRNSVITPSGFMCATLLAFSSVTK